MWVRPCLEKRHPNLDLCSEFRQIFISAVFSRSEAGIVGSNHPHKAWLFGVCMCLFCVVLSCV
jgi:hypothetical protein